MISRSAVHATLLAPPSIPYAVEFDRPYKMAPIAAIYVIVLSMQSRLTFVLDQLMCSPSTKNRSILVREL